MYIVNVNGGNNVLTDYENCVLIGSGGFGEVFKCKNNNGQICALKVLKREYHYNNLVIKRFQREIRAHSKLVHSNIIPIFEYDVDSEFYFTMPLASSNLEEYLINKNDDDLILFNQVLQAVKHSHDNGIIHRDLKPSNILIGQHDVPMITDFGLAKFTERDSTTLTGSNEFWGTTMYAAPEQFGQTRDVEKTADIYSLGKILYKITTSQNPYPELDSSIIPSKYQFIIRKACRTNPDDRFQSIDEFIRQLDYVKFRLIDPVSSVNDEAEKILLDNDFSSSNTADLARILYEHRSNNIILNKSLPNMNEKILKSLIENHNYLVYPVFEAFDEDASSDRLPFDYCDVVADFYKTLYNLTDDYDSQVLVIKRLPQLGSYYNRYHVGHIIGEIVEETDDISLLMELKELFQSNNEVAEWCEEYISRNKFNEIMSSVQQDDQLTS